MDRAHTNFFGFRLILIASFLAFLVSLYNFFAPNTGISYTGGAELVIITSFAILILSYLAHRFHHQEAKWERFVLGLAIFCLIVGSGFAGLLLEAWIFFGLLIVCLIGWFIQIVTR